MSIKAIRALRLHELTSDEFKLLYCMIECSIDTGDAYLHLKNIEKAVSNSGLTPSQAERVWFGLRHQNVTSGDFNLLSYRRGVQQPAWSIDGMKPDVNPKFPSHRSEISIKYSKPGYIYVIRAVDTPWYKIGITQDLERRAKELGAKAPFDIDTVFGVRVLNNADLEKLLHEKFKSKRKNGEWFELSADDLAFIERAIEADKVDEYTLRRPDSNFKKLVSEMFNLDGSDEQ